MSYDLEREEIRMDTREIEGKNESEPLNSPDKWLPLLLRKTLEYRCELWQAAHSAAAHDNGPESTVIGPASRLTRDCWWLLW